MQRPDLDTLACVNPACQLLHRAGASNLGIRKVYGHDRLRLRRCRPCGEECSERRGSALFNTKIAEDTVARLLRLAGRHAARFHDRHVRDLTPRAVAFDEQWSFVVRRIGLVRERG